MEPHPIVSMRERLAIWVVIGTTTVSVLSSAVWVAHSADARASRHPSPAGIVHDATCATACTRSACTGQP